MGPNFKASLEIIETLLASGVKEFCVCAGSRNSPLVSVLSSGAFDLRIYSFPDERAAAFYALGRCQLTNKPVAVVTTSGTAAAEMLPAVIEAHYSKWPLICVTADRPRHYRGTGAPQSIEQLNLYGTYVEACIDFEAGEKWDLKAWGRQRPLHINVCFDEPLIDGEISSMLDVNVEEPRKSPRLALTSSPSFTETHAAVQEIEAFLNKCKRPLVIVAALLPSEREPVRAFLAKLHAPIWAEALSGLREDVILESCLLKSGERILARGGFDGVLRIGGVPTLRYWRDLESQAGEKLPVCHISRVPFTGLTRGIKAFGDVARTLTMLENAPSFELPAELFQLDRSLQERFQEIILEQPRSELALIHSFSRFVPPRSKIFLGNSLPIREWDLASTRRFRGLECRGNRGANGIDGEVSTFLGQCDPELSNWALLGDLTTIYDLSAPWVVPQLPETLSFQIVVINNGGGRIFSRVRSLDPVDPDTRKSLFENSHGVRFGDWARMWNLGFEEWTEMPPQPPASSQGVVELRPDTDSSQRAWELYDRLWSVS